jgi:phospholipid transport system transporter-binding protein
MTDVATQSVSGLLTYDTVAELYRSSGSWFAGQGDLVIDLAQVTRADSAGLALMVEWLRRAQTAGRKLRFANVPAQMQTLIRVNGLQGALLNGSNPSSA